jgi:hypothetical protein
MNKISKKVLLQHALKIKCSKTSSRYCPFKRNQGGQKNKKLLYEGRLYAACAWSELMPYFPYKESCGGGGGEGRRRMQGIFRRNMAAEGESRQGKRDGR